MDRVTAVRKFLPAKSKGAIEESKEPRLLEKELSMRTKSILIGYNRIARKFLIITTKFTNYITNLFSSLI